ncbi:MAG: tetratricopeptide repeat protein, partial [Candidatus Sumerlaeia bacterium]|nr:tetratricopeptide repeat protein [Candidatus Sumerlaeia bacterium]
AEVRQWLSRILRPEFIPKELELNLIPLRNWAIFYRDWIDHGGSDTFIVKYKMDKYVIQISETINYVILAVRDLALKTPVSKDEHRKYVLEMAQRLLVSEIQPPHPGAIVESKAETTGELTVGFWAPPPFSLPKKADNVEETPAETISDSIKFCTDGQLVIFQVLKYIWTGEMQNPFEPRFAPEISTKADDSLWRLVEQQLAESKELNTPEKRIEFYERIKNRIVTRQIEEYLGPMLYNYEGVKLTATVPIALIEHAFNQLDDTQKNYLIKQRKSDELYIEGLKAFNQKRYDIAVDNWSSALKLEPLNVRCALLLMVATDYLKEKMQATLGKVDYENPTLGKAVDALLSHRQAILKYELTQREETLKEREISKHRILALDYYAKGQYQEAINEWNEVLKIDPGNPQAALFIDLASRRMKSKEGETAVETTGEKK